MSVQDIPYFAATLGYAKLYNERNPHGFETINAVIEDGARRKPSSHIVGFCRPLAVEVGKEKVSKWVCDSYTFGDLHRLSLSLAKMLERDMGFPDISCLSPGKIIALLCPSSEELLITWLALVKSGYGVLLIAPECTAKAIVHLCKSTGASAILAHPMYTELAVESESEACHTDKYRLTYRSLPLKEAWPNSLEIEGSSSKSRISFDTVAYIHHTSGTSGLPKPIPHTHKAATMDLPRIIPQGPSGQFVTTPLYHGGAADLFRGIMSNSFTCFYPSSNTAITASNIISALKAIPSDNSAKIRYFSAVPYILNLMAEDAEGLRVLRSMEIVGVGGAQLPKQIGDKLVKNDVNLINRFGSSECGCRDFNTDKNWDALKPQSASEHLIFENRGPNVYELVVLPGWPHLIKPKGRTGAYHTSDLFAPHENISGAWKYMGRSDALLALQNGKKFDPTVIEDILKVSDVVQDALVFGIGCEIPGLLAIRSHQNAFISENEFLEKVWFVLKKANENMPSYARVPKQLMVALPYGTEYPKTSKGTPLRNEAYTRFDPLICQTYARFEHGSENGVRKKFSLKEEAQLQKYLLELLKDLLKNAGKSAEYLHIDTDLFSFGLDSSLAIQFRSQIMKEIDTESNLSPNVIYEARTIRILSSHIVGKKLGKTANTEERMLWLKQAYSILNPAELNTEAGYYATERNAVLITGATGSLGSSIAVQIAKADRNRHQYNKFTFICRAKNDEDATTRMDYALKKRGSSIEDLIHRGFEVECRAGRFDVVRFALEKPVWARLSAEVSCIFHSAWPVNFAASLDSFEDQLIGLRNLLEFVIAKGNCNFCFISSTAAVINSPCQPIIEKVSDSPSDAVPLGYAQSKWVAESLCIAAYDTCPSKVKILRVGQLCGDTENGLWNETEGWPLLFRTLSLTRGLPVLNEVPNWLPVDIAADAIFEISQDENPNQLVYHVAAKTTSTSWISLLDALSSVLEVPVERYGPSVWIHKLSEGISKIVLSGMALPPYYNLLGLWTEKYVGRTTLPVIHISIKHACEASPTFRSVTERDLDLLPVMKKTFSQWKRDGLFTTLEI